MTLTDAELREVAARAIDRAVRQVLGDDVRLLPWRVNRLYQVAGAELEKIERNLSANGAGRVRLGCQSLRHGLTPIVTRLEG